MDFRAHIVADLDTSKAKSELSKLTKNQEMKLGVNIAVKNANDLKQIQNEAKRLQSVLNQKYNIRIDNKQAIKSATDTLKQIEKINSQLQKKTQSVSSSYWKQTFDNQFADRHSSNEILDRMRAFYREEEKVANEVARKQLEIQQRTKQQILSIQKDVSSGSFQLRNAQNQAFLDKYTSQQSDALIRAKSQIENIKKLQNQLTSGSLSDNQMISTYQKLNDEVKRLANSMKQVNVENTKTLSAGVASTGANRIRAYYEANTKAVKQYGAQLKQLEAEYRSITTQGEKTVLDNRFRQLQSEISAAGLTGKSNIDDLKRAATKIGQFVGIYGMLQYVAYQVPRKMASSVIDINSSQIELTKVSTASITELSEYWDKAAVSAKKYGASIDGVINSTADWSRLGYNLKEAEKLSDATTLMEKIGDNMTQESSSEGIISTLKGFEMEADEVTRIVDEVNEVANTQPIDTSGIFEGLSRSASSMNAANNSLEQTIALITAANSVVQDPASVGTAFKTISMRIRGATTELEEAGLETDGMAESTASLRKEIMALSGIDIMKDKDTFKSTYDILDELSAKWDDLTDIQQASVTELIAGKRQGNVVSALMSNFDIARETLDTAMNDSAGSAERELANYQKGIQYSLETFQATFQEFSMATLDSDMFKGLIDSGTGFLNILTQIIDVGNGLPALASVVAGIFSATGKGKHKVIVVNALFYKVA